MKDKYRTTEIDGRCLGRMRIRHHLRTSTADCRNMPPTLLYGEDKIVLDSMKLPRRLMDTAPMGWLVPSTTADKWETFIKTAMMLGVLIPKSWSRRVAV